MQRAPCSRMLASAGDRETHASLEVFHGSRLQRRGAWVFKKTCWSSHLLLPVHLRAVLGVELKAAISASSDDSPFRA